MAIVVIAAPSSHGDEIDVKLQARFNDFRVQLSSGSAWLASLSMADLHVGVEMRRGHTQVTTGLSQLSVVDLTPAIKHDKVLSMTSDEVFRAEVSLYNRTEPVEQDFVDLELSAQLGGARLLFMNRFIADLLAFMAPFSATQAALAEASQTAADAAQQAMHNAYAQAFRAKLSVTMKAPVILVPQSSRSDRVLVADLGNLNVSNRLEMGPWSQLSTPAVLDKMTLKLDNLKFYRGQLAADGSVHSECLILQPVTLAVQVTRNLSVSWYRDEPEIDILATLGDLTVVLSETDYAQIMRTLNENLSESGTAELKPLPPPSPAAEAAHGASRSGGTTSTAVAHLETTLASVYTKLRFSFDWTFVGVELFTSSAEEKVGTAGSHARLSAVEKRCPVLY
ncbi:vacuolar protein sorting-associated protein 13C-like [Pollicipes pollicipes]|uniref:vacuolar protein sorting-associated protein 13C-like n=1 Tax=Pollicipes pollicipes TaxID=41117 RepID=UPI00188501CA|nr:vacuolar protein sorting-associated protein 13C-like [Pollicipes pollicipes]